MTISSSPWLVSTDPLPARAEEIAAEHNAQVLPDAETLIAADYIDAVIIASSTETHCPLMLAAVRAGKKVYCEKPLASTLTEAHDVDTAMVTLRTASGALCQIDNARRAVYGFDDRIEIFGTGGLAESSRITEGSVMRIFDDKILTEGLPKDPMIRMAPSYAAAIQAFTLFVRDYGQPDAAPVPGVYDELRAQMMAEAATRAASERRIVSLAEIESEIR